MYNKVSSPLVLLIAKFMKVELENVYICPWKNSLPLIKSFSPLDDDYESRYTFKTL